MQIARLKEYRDGQNLVVEVLEPSKKKAVLSYMRSFPISAVAAGYYEDVTTGEEIVASYIAYDDDEFKWNTCDIYHLEKYDLALKPDFIKKALSA